MDAGLVALKAALAEMPAIRRCLRALGVPLSVHDDAVQDTLLRAWRGGRTGTFPAHEGAGGQRAWLLVVAARAANDLTKRRKGFHDPIEDHEPFLADETPSAVWALEHREIAQAVLAELRADPLWPIVEGYFLEGATVAEMAASTGVKESTCWNRLRLARARLCEIGIRLQARAAHEVR